MTAIQDYRNNKHQESPEAYGTMYYYGYGWEDVLFERESLYDFTSAARLYQTTPSALEAANTLGRREAEEERSKNPARFYLQELKDIMQTAGEWYGDDFDRPLWIIEQVLQLLEEKEQANDG